MYDLFLSYHWRDHETVEAVAEALRDSGIKPFLDRWYLVPGRRWVEVLEQTLSECRSVAIFLGPEGMGRWQQREKEYALDRQTRDPAFSVIPVLLQGADPALGFLPLNTWVDLRQGRGPDKIEVLVRAARGLPPGDDLKRSITNPLATICPYRGLSAFREEDEPFFYGREDFTGKLVAAVNKSAFIPVVGASGSGKSSAVRAGLIPALRRAKDRRVWDMITLKPQAQPLQSLARALIPLLEPEMTEVQRLEQATNLADLLVTRKIELSALIDRCLERQPGTDQILLVIDQWEELYTLCHDDNVRQGFIQQLIRGSKAGTLTVILTLRWDFVAKSRQDLPDQFADGIVPISPMSRAELQRAIVEPARKVGLRFEEGLVERVLDDLGEEPGKLPLLEFLLQELWKKRHGGDLLHEAYEAIGGVRKAIAERAEAEFDKLSSAEQELAHWALVQLVAPGEGREDTRRRALLQELEEAAQGVVTKLAAEKTRLLVTTRDSMDREVVEVAHEALIREWDRLRRWVDNDREFLRTQLRLSEEAAFWRKSNRPADLLLPAGRWLAEAEELLKLRPQLVGPQIRDYVETSVSAERIRRDAERKADRKRLEQRVYLFGSAAAVAAVLLGIALVSRHEAQMHAQIAANNFALTLRSTASLVSKVGDNLKFGLISAPAGQELLSEAESTLVDLGKFKQTPEVSLQQIDLLLSMSDAHVHLGQMDKALKNAISARQLVDSARGAPNADPQFLLFKISFRVGDALLAQLHLNEAMKEYRAGLEIATEARQANPADPKWDGYPSFMHNKVGDVLKAQGFLSAAVAEYRRSLSVAETFAKSRPNLVHQRELAAAHERVGQAMIARGDYDEALKHFLNTLEIRDRLAEEFQKDASLRNNLAAIHTGVGEVLMEHGDLEKAAEHFNKSFRIRRELTTLDASRATWQRPYSQAYLDLGDLMIASNQHSKALASYREALTIRQQLVEKDGTNRFLQRNVALGFLKIGDALVEQGESGAAMTEYQKALAIWEDVLKKHPADVECAREHVLGLTKIGHALVRSTPPDLRGAREQLERGLKRAAELAGKMPDNAQLQALLATVHFKLGDTLGLERDHQSALRQYRSALSVTMRLAAKDEDVPTRQFERAMIHAKMADALASQARLISMPGAVGQGGDEAAENYTTAVTIVDGLVKRHPHNVKWKNELEVIRGKARSYSQTGRGN